VNHGFKGIERGSYYFTPCLWVDLPHRLGRHLGYGVFEGSVEMRGGEKGVDVLSALAPPEDYCQDRIFEGIIVVKRI
jgi:hypothetical protein